MEHCRALLRQKTTTLLCLDLSLLAQLSLCMFAIQVTVHGGRTDRMNLPVCACAVFFFSRRILPPLLDWLRAEQALSGGIAALASASPAALA